MVSGLNQNTFLLQIGPSSLQVSFFHFCSVKIAFSAALLMLQKLRTPFFSTISTTYEGSMEPHRMSRCHSQDPGKTQEVPINIKLFGSKPPISKKKIRHWFSKLKKTRSHRGSFEPTEPPLRKKYTKIDDPLQRLLFYAMSCLKHPRSLGNS